MIPEFILELPTPRLLNYYKKHYRHGRNPYCDYYGAVEPEDQEQFDKWNEARDTIRAELNRREHVNA